MEGHIYIYGIISPYMEDKVSQYGEINIKDLNNQLTNNKEADTLIVHINSNGGDVYQGYAFHDVLKATGKKIITQCEGIVASIATVIFFAGSERLMLENSQLMIHNPWGMAMGDSSDVQKYADQLKGEEDKLAQFYATETGLTKEECLALMKEETFMTADQAIEKKFATGKATQIKAVAQLNINNQMTEKELETKIEEKSNGIMSKINAMLKKFGVIKALVLKSSDGKDLDFGDAITESSEIAVGTKATVDGSPAEGEFVMPDGKTLVFVAGAVTEIKEPADDKALKDEIEALKAEKATLEASIAEKETTINSMKTELTTFKASITSDITGLKNELLGDPGATVRKPFKK